MTPAVKTLNKLKIPYLVHEYRHDAKVRSYGLEAAEQLNQPVDRVFKTLVVEDNEGNLGVGIVPVSCELDLKRIASCLGAKKAKMANPEKVERTTGYVLGGVSPIGQKKSLPTVLDDSAQNQTSIFVSGGKRGLDIEIAPGDLIHAIRGRYESIGISK